MCRRFTVVTWDEVAEVVRELQADSPVNAQPDWPAHPMAGEAAAAQVEPGEDAFPGAGVDVIVRGPESQLAVERLTWGFPVEWQQRPVYNTRLETAMGPNPGMWEQPIAQGRGIVVTGGFFEAHATQMARSPKTGRRIKQQYRFESGDGMRSRPLLSSDHAPERQRCARAQPYAPGANARRGALVVARAVAQPGGQLAKASKSRRVRANGGPGATGSPGRAWAGDVVLVGVSRLNCLPFLGLEVKSENGRF
ncbi:SOS response-associated peptidase family protein, partial [Senegalimassilia anaerobia]|uniref:SOS response-associated peptidase family protein n=1 Tax=Senegalimassilia anaerobia TaxID=1473216 RepID=UPI00265D84FD